MKSAILALTALLTICTAAPAIAQTDVDFGVTVGDRAGVVIVPARRRNRDYYPYYNRSDWHRRPRYRIYRPDWYRSDRFYYPYKYNQRYHHRYRHGRYYYPRRNSVQIRIGF
jgi:hypothetical protein